MPQSAHPPLAAWGLREDVVPLEGGHRNAVWRTTGPGPSYVLKSSRHSADSFTWLLDVQNHARRAGFIVPEFLPSRAGRILEQGWTCEEFIDGDAVAPDMLPSLAAPMNHFHDACHGIGQRPGSLGALDALVQDKGEDVDLTAMPDLLVEACRKAWRAVQDTPVSVVHGDLTPSNILRTRTGQIALLDWDECRRDLVLFDQAQTGSDTPAVMRAALAWEVTSCWTREPDRARALAKGLYPPADM